MPAVQLALALQPRLACIHQLGFNRLWPTQPHPACRAAGLGINVADGPYSSAFVVHNHLAFQGVDNLDTLSFWTFSGACARARRRCPALHSGESPTRVPDLS